MKKYELHNLIEFYRNYKHMTQKQLAIKCGVSTNTICCYEKRRYYPSAFMAAKLCKVLDVKFEQLFILQERN